MINLGLFERRADRDGDGMRGSRARPLSLSSMDKGWGGWEVCARRLTDGESGLRVCFEIA